MKTFDIFAKEIGFNKSVLDNFVTFSHKYYNTFYLKTRKKGKKREIDCPSKELKSIQRWLMANYLNEIPVSKHVNGFVKGRGIKRNAQYHLNKEFILCIDIQDFFPSISQGQVYNSLQKHFDNKELCLKIAKLCTYKRKLPQGAPTSPVLSNIVFREIDEEITKFCNSMLIAYSRYADDLVFSSMTKDSLVEAYSFVNDILRKNSFAINKKKTKYLSGKGRMSVTGINLNEGRLTVKKSLKRNLRSSLYNFIVKKDSSVNINSALGYLSFIKDIEPEYYEKTKSYIEKLKKKAV